MTTTRRISTFPNKIIKDKAKNYPKLPAWKDRRPKPLPHEWKKYVDDVENIADVIEEMGGGYYGDYEGGPW